MSSQPIQLYQSDGFITILHMYMLHTVMFEPVLICALGVHCYYHVK